jgi:hypothetical protein
MLNVPLKNRRMGDIKLPRQIDPKEDVSERTKFSLNTLLQHFVILSGFDHH